MALLAATLIGCGGTTAKTNLSIEVASGWGQQHYRLTCGPAGGDVPRPAELCNLLAENSDVMLFRPKNNSTCIGGVGTVHLHVRGTVDRQPVDANEIDACQGNPEAQSLWLSELPAPTQSP